MKVKAKEEKREICLQRPLILKMLQTQRRLHMSKLLKTPLMLKLWKTK